MVSAYYYARSIDLNHYKVGDVLTFKAFVDGKVEPIRIKYIGKETVKIKSGKYRCFKFQPIVQSGRVFNDPNDLVAKVIVGSVKLELMTTERLLHPLAKL